MYHYPDVNDRNLTENVINKDWEDGGCEDKFLKKTLSCEVPQKIVLDVGCGQGRLFKYFIAQFDFVFALDPDISRLNDAKQKLKELNSDFFYKSQFFNCCIQNFKSKNKFDLIVCSHIIQHIHTAEVPKVLQAARDYLKDDGCFILSTTNWEESLVAFDKTNTKTNERIFINEEEFNEVVVANNHWLPTRLFTDDALVKLINDADLQILSLDKYHGYPKIRGDKFIVMKKK